MLRIGCHLSSAAGYAAMGAEALRLDAGTFQFFLRNPRGGRAKALDFDDIAAFIALAHEHNIAPVLAHASYTMNLCSADPLVRSFAAQVLADDLKRMEHTPGNLYNLHPGSHVGQGVKAGIALIADALNAALQPNGCTTVLLETMAGKGSEIGGCFEELRAILDALAVQEGVGVCLDTCHVFDAGYDIVNNLEGVLETFDTAIGLDRLFAVHLNDSANPLGSRKDRHAKIGQGHIGLDAFARIINHPRLRTLPFYLETPNDLAGYAEEIRLLKSLAA